MSLHFCSAMRASDQVRADPAGVEAIKTMIDDHHAGLHVIGTGSQGVRHISARRIHKVDDIKG